MSTEGDCQSRLKTKLCVVYKGKLNIKPQAESKGVGKVWATTIKARASVLILYKTDLRRRKISRDKEENCMKKLY